MTKDEIAKRLNITRVTLYNWEKTKPELIKIINEYYNKQSEMTEANEILKYFYKLDPQRQELYFTKIKLEVLEKETN